MKSGFVFWVCNSAGGTGSGHSISLGDVHKEGWCSPRDYPTMRKNWTITGTLGPVNGSTVAVCSQNGELYQAGRQLYIHGLGVKTVTNACDACCGDGTHLDNYTTSTACSLNFLPDAKTIILY